MADPQTPQIGFYIPLRGSDSGVWDLPENANDSATDNLFANVAIISLSNAPVTLTAPPNSGAAWAGPYQSQSALLRFTGNLSANVAVTLPRAGFFIVENLCTSGGATNPPLAGSIAGTFVVTLQSAAPGDVIGVPPGRKVHVFCDGTDVDFVDLENPGTQVDWTGLTAMPAWVTACTDRPYLLRDGANYPIASYPALYSMLGNQFGGTFGLNFNVPDSGGRVDVPWSLSGRLSGASGVNGAVMASAGGDERFQAHSHNAVVHDPTHAHGVGGGFIGGNGFSGLAGGGSFNGPIGATNIAIFAAATGISVTIGNTGTGGSLNVQPTIVSFLAVIKT